jgi:hypothetical protein
VLHDADARDHGSATQLAVLTVIAEFDFACLTRTRLTMSAFLIASEPVMHFLQSLPVPLQKPWALSGCC